jgi:hypothetical protein
MITDIITKFMELLSTLTKEEADFIENVLSWTDEKKIAFKLAKRLFEEDENEETQNKVAKVPE